MPGEKWSWCWSGYLEDFHDNDDDRDHKNDDDHDEDGEGEFVAGISRLIREGHVLEVAQGRRILGHFWIEPIAGLRST